MFRALDSNLDCDFDHIKKKPPKKQEKSPLGLLFEFVIHSDEGSIILEYSNITSVFMISLTNKEIKNSIDNIHQYEKKFPKKLIFSPQKKLSSNKSLTILLAGEISIRGLKFFYFLQRFNHENLWDSK
jgi:hypothetical protein